MAISPVGPVEESSLPEPSRGDSRSPNRAGRPSGEAAPQTASAGDSVQLSETARGMARTVGDPDSEEKLHLSPKELRAMLHPEEEDVG
jgi:hypothetical protein